MSSKSIASEKEIRTNASSNANTNTEKHTQNIDDIQSYSKNDTDQLKLTREEAVRLAVLKTG